MPLVEQYPNWKSFESVGPCQDLINYFYTNSTAWTRRPAQGFFAECAWYKFPYCSAVPWYTELNQDNIIGRHPAKFYELAKPLFDHANEQLGNDFLFWGAELNSVPPGINVTKHFDRHFYSDYATRVHIVLQTNEYTYFQFENIRHAFKQGECFLFNNKLSHAIQNSGLTDRLHLVIDFIPKQVFKYIERSIAPFGGHEGTKHILSYLHKSNPSYSEYIRSAGPLEIYPSKTAEFLS
jgi:hypothetical protein